MAHTKSQSTSHSRFKLEYIILGIFILLLLIGAFFDKPISHTIMNQDSIFGTIFQNYSLFFPNVIIFISAQVLFYRVQKSDLDPFAKSSVMLMAIIASIYEMWLATKIALLYTVSSLNNIKHKAPLGAANNDTGKHGALPGWYLPTLISLTLIFVVIGLLLCYKWLAKKEDTEMKRLTYIALAAIVAVYAGTTLLNTMKMYWGRMRPYEMNHHWSNFTAWYHINGENGHKSFPSGHAQEVWISIILPLFVSPKQAKKRRNLFIATAVFSFIVVLSRLRIGAHFLSDVTVGSFISIFVVYVMSRIVNEKLMGNNQLDD